MSADDAGTKALTEIGNVLGQRPHKDDHALSEAMQQLCLMRETWIADRDRSHDPADDQRLAQLNGVISVVIGAHFPLGETPWAELEKARGWLAALIYEPVGTSA